LNVFGIYKLIG